VSDNIYKQTIEKWGEPLQIIVAIEEMSELTKALTKWFRQQTTKSKICEEIADVEIMLEQLRIMFDDSNKVDYFKRQKIKRLDNEIHKTED